MRQQFPAIVWPATPLAATSTLLTGLTGYWKLDESAGATRNDSTANANHLTDHNTVGSSAGKIGNAANFVSASSRYLSHADAAAFQMGSSTDFSLAAWVKYTATNQLFVCYGQFGATNKHYYFTNGTGISAVVGDGTTNVTVGAVHAFDDNAWHLAIMTASRTGNLTLYVDNTVEGVPTSISTLGSLNNTLGFAIGADPLPQLYFDGSVDEVGLWNRVLTSGELTELWNAGAGKTYPFT